MAEFAIGSLNTEAMGVARLVAAHNAAIGVISFGRFENRDEVTTAYVEAFKATYKGIAEALSA